MPLPAFLLRLMLCLALVLNGSGYAVASTKMHLAHIVHAGHNTDMTARDAARPCHSRGEGAVQARAHDAGVPAGAHHGKPDCCTTLGACDCLQHASLAMTASQPFASWVPHAPSTCRNAAEHTPPVLASPIRPPIA